MLRKKKGQQQTGEPPKQKTPEELAEEQNYWLGQHYSNPNGYICGQCAVNGKGNVRLSHEGKKAEDGTTDIFPTCPNCGRITWDWRDMPRQIEGSKSTTHHTYFPPLRWICVIVLLVCGGILGLVYHYSPKEIIIVANFLVVLIYPTILVLSATFASRKHLGRFVLLQVLIFAGMVLYVRVFAQPVSDTKLVLALVGLLLTFLIDFANEHVQRNK